MSGIVLVHRGSCYLTQEELACSCRLVEILASLNGEVRGDCKPFESTWVYSMLAAVENWSV